MELFYDVISPYSWIAFETLIRYRKLWDLDLKLRPFLLGAVMKSAGNKPPAMVPNKAVYMFKDLQRLSQLYDVPIKPPPFFMEFIMTKTTLKPQRFLTALDLRCPEPASRGFWKRFYLDNEDIAEDDSIASVGKAAGLSEEALRDVTSFMTDDRVKDTLKARTTEAVEKYGAFGAPTLVLNLRFSSVATASN